MTDVFLRQGAANPNDITLRDPTTPDTGVVTKSIGTNGRHYSTIAAWIASLPANLVTAGNSCVGECYNDSEFNEGGLSLAGHTTDSTHTITLTAAAGQSFADNANKLTNALKYNQANGVAWTGSASYGSMLSITDNYVTISRLQSKETSNNTAPTWFSSGANNLYSQCILQSFPRANYNLIYYDNAGFARNCLLLNTASGSRAGASLRGNHGTKFTNCTIVSPSDNATVMIAVASGYGSDTVITNCAVFGLSNGFSGTFGTCSNTCTDLASAPGTSNQLSKTFTSQFVGTTSGTPDYRLKAGADCINNGVTDTTDIPAANDIVGTSRPQSSAWDIGCWELIISFKPRLIRWSA